MDAFKCPKCGKTTSSREKFCIDCGATLDMICPECGNNWRFMFDYKFCPNCGHQMKKEDKKEGIKATDPQTKKKVNKE
jgi:predicted RNA-binding Zn-ribbon protein involved in translation (DUF1610 family)